MMEGLRDFYLLLYNGGQTVGWSYVLCQLILYHIGVVSNISLWNYIGWPVIIFQNAAVLEIFNAYFRLVRSNPILTTFQVFSRIMVVCGVIIATPEAKMSPGLPLALLAWSITEIIRYSYYTLNTFNSVPFVITWLRYTTFVILYPIGVTGELLCFYWAQNYTNRHAVWSIEMPNKYNFTFSYFYFLWFVMFSYIPIFPQLYLHMFMQRKKTFGISKSN